MVRIAGRAARIRLVPGRVLPGAGRLSAAAVPVPRAPLRGGRAARRRPAARQVGIPAGPGRGQLRRQGVVARMVPARRPAVPEQRPRVAAGSAAVAARRDPVAAAPPYPAARRQAVDADAGAEPGQPVPWPGPELPDRSGPGHVPGAGRPGSQEHDHRAAADLPHPRGHQARRIPGNRPFRSAVQRPGQPFQPGRGHPAVAAGPAVGLDGRAADGAGAAAQPRPAGDRPPRLRGTVGVLAGQRPRGRG